MPRDTVPTLLSVFISYTSCMLAINDTLFYHYLAKQFKIMLTLCLTKSFSNILLFLYDDAVVLVDAVLRNDSTDARSRINITVASHYRTRIAH